MGLFKEKLSELHTTFKQRKQFGMLHGVKELLDLKQEEYRYDLPGLDIHKSKNESMGEYLKRVTTLPSKLTKEILFLEDCLRAIEEVEALEKQELKSVNPLQRTALGRVPLPPTAIASSNAIRSERGKKTGKTDNSAASLTRAQATAVLREKKMAFLKKNLTEVKATLRQWQTDLEAVKIKTLESDAPLMENSIQIRIWRNPFSGKRRKLFGFDSGGHISIEVHKDGKREYLSFYPDKNQPPKKPSVWARLLKRWGFPSNDKIPSKVITSISEDLTRLYVDNNNPGKYSACETIVINANDAGLDLDAIIKYMNNEKANPREFEFYSQNCTAIGFEALKAGGAENILPFPTSSHIATIPAELVSYAENLVSLSERKKMKNLETTTVDKNTNYYKEIFDYFNALISSLEPYITEPNDAKQIAELKRLLIASGIEIDGLSMDKLPAALEKIYEAIEIKIVLIGESPTLALPLKKEVEYRMHQLLSMLPETKKSALHHALSRTNSLINEKIASTLQYYQGSKNPVLQEKTAEVSAILADLNKLPTDYVDSVSPYQTALAFKEAIDKLQKLRLKEKERPSKNHVSLTNLYNDSLTVLKDSLKLINEQLYFEGNLVLEGQDNMTVKKELGIILLGESGENSIKVDDIIDESIALFSVIPLRNVSANYANTIQSLHNVLKSDAASSKKLLLINEYVDKNKPSIFAFWNNSLRKNFELMRSQAILTVSISDFLKGDLSLHSLIDICHKNQQHLPMRTQMSVERFIKLIQTKDSELVKAYEEFNYNAIQSSHYSAMDKELGVFEKKTDTPHAINDNKKDDVKVSRKTDVRPNPNLVEQEASDISDRFDI